MGRQNRNMAPNTAAKTTPARAITNPRYTIQRRMTVVWKKTPSAAWRMSFWMVYELDPASRGAWGTSTEAWREAEHSRAEEVVTTLITDPKKGVSHLSGDDAERPVLALNRRSHKSVHHRKIGACAKSLGPAVSPALPSRENNVVALEGSAVEARQLLRRILEIAIHDCDPAPPTLGNPCRDCRMLSEIATQTDCTDPRIPRRKLVEEAPRTVGASIVNEKDLEAVEFRL